MQVPTRKTVAQTAAIVLGLGVAVAPHAAFAQSTAAQTNSAQANAAAKLDDPTIVAIFDAANTWDMETSALGAKKGTTKEVRDFGSMMVRDHRSLRQQGRDLAKRLGVTPTPPKNFAMAKDHDNAMERLRKAHGAAFDREYMQHEIAYHKAVIAAINSMLLPATRNADLKALEVRVAPLFQAHLATAENVAAKLERSSK